MLDQSIAYLKGVGPQKAELLQKELQVYTVADLLWQLPFRYIDKTKFTAIAEITDDTESVLIKGILRRVEIIGEGFKKRAVARLRDETGFIDLVWFKGLNWLEKNLEAGGAYIVYGKPQFFNTHYTIAHPEMELATEDNKQQALTFAPIYNSTEKLNNKGLDVKARRKLILQIFEKLKPADIPEILPIDLIRKLKLIERYQALYLIHFPKNEAELEQATRRLKFEELFLIQMRILQLKKNRKASIRGHVFSTVGDLFNTFYTEKLPFALTEAQKRVLKEIRKDLGSGIQMNRLVQGDVGSGKTIVAFLSMLIGLGNGFQACLMAPTEILARQHFEGLTSFGDLIGITIEFLSGSVKGKKRQLILEKLASGEIDILIGTHALIEEPVSFKNLGLAIIDEQHRFGVEQRGKLWNKSKPCPPHILVMTATPIPRTLAMTLYGDLDVSVIDELPPGRKPITTLHWTENQRLRLTGFIREEISKGRQVYVVYPLIEESEKMDLLDLMQGYENIVRDFPLPQYQVSIVHGKLKNQEKDYEMQRFVSGTTQIMVATTVIEVGVNVPNASVMIVENSERFGLSQLHQLRGRVGRGADQSFCILMSSFKLSADAREKLKTLVRTNNGFEIAEVDLKLRGPGDIEGKQQSGLLNLRIANLAKDGIIVQTARELANELLDQDPQLIAPQHLALKNHLEQAKKYANIWSRIS